MTWHIMAYPSSLRTAVVGGVLLAPLPDSINRLPECLARQCFEPAMSTSLLPNMHFNGVGTS